MKRQDELNKAWCKYRGKCSTEIMQALAFALRWADEHPSWISVEDELPEDNKVVLVYSGLEDDIFTAYHNGEYWCTNDRCTVLHNVTHWMPLPQPPKKETKWVEHTLQRDKYGFLVGEVSDLGVHLPFEVHNNEDDTWELVEDGSALVDWSGDIDTKPRYDKIRTNEQVVSNSENTGKEEDNE